MKILAKTDTWDWDYYIKGDKVYAISKDGNKERNCCFGSLRHTLYILLNNKGNFTLNKDYKEEIELIMRRNANKEEMKRYKKIKYENME